MFVSSTSPALSAYAHAPNSMQARVRQEEVDARENPVDGPVEERAATKQQPNRVGATGKPEQLTPSEEKQVRELKKRDAEVRRHEHAHLGAAGPYAQGPPQYEYQTGPDGKQYAIGGHVKIDTSPVPGDPQATMEKARIVRRAALAAKDPSPADRSIAQKAARMEMKARQELKLQRLEERKKEKNSGVNAPFQAFSRTRIHIPTMNARSTLTENTEQMESGQPSNVHPEVHPDASTGSGAFSGSEERLLEAFPANYVDRYA